MLKTLLGFFRSSAEEPAAGLSTQHEAHTVAALQGLRNGLLAANVQLATSHEQPMLEALLRRRKLEAIKILREGAEPRISLGAAKDIVDQIDSRLRRR